MASNSELIREALPQCSSSQDSEGETDSDEEHLRMLLPTLLKQLQTILSEYPDSSQIIKEIIQNADDADATEMKICYESCQSHPDPEQTWSKYFSAPALCFYNDAEFSKKDWEGIRTIYSSVKEEDPLKVGRFGLGFKSVFHITDHPTIISGDKLLVIDPHQRDLDYVCWRKSLKKAAGLKTSLSAIFGKFGFTENSLESGKFRGTLFWLPLREKPSKLSNNLYSKDKINNLFHSFKTEAPITLLFLKSLEKIEWFDGSNMLYRVQVRETGGHIRCERKRFQQEIKAKNKTQENTDVVSKTEMSIETKSCSDRDSEEQIQRWLVVNLLKREKLSDEMRLLLEDKSLSYPPYVGVAVPLNMDMSEFKGHVFCILPLPLEARSITGLPVHVNGFFALSQNRRHVRWSSAGEKRNNCISWNEGLVKELLPEAYNILLQKLIVNSEDSNNTPETLSLVHKSIPDEKCVLDNWRLLLAPLYSAILKENFLYTINNCWVDYAKCVLPPVQSMDKVIWKVVRHLYHQAGEHLVEVPKHIVQMLQKHVSGGVITASPDHLCHILRSSDAVYKDLSVCEKLYLLNFLACDEQYSRLEGLKLLPLNDQNFLTFKKDTGGDRHIFHCSLEEIQMFPGLGHMVVMSDFPYELPVAIGKRVREHILNIANQGVYQIFKMMPNDTAKLIELTIQKNSEQMFESGISFWFISDTTVLSDSWIDNIWEYLKKHFDDLQLFFHLPIVTYLNNKSTGGKRLYKLSETMILRTRRGADSLPESLCEALECLGVLVLPSLKESMLSHPCLLDTFVKGPSVHGVVQIISQCSATGVTNFNKICSGENKRALVDYLDGIKEIPEAALCTLRRLELFLLTQGPETATCYGSVEKCREVAPKQKLSINFPRPLLYLKNTAERHLASFLGCSTITLEELVAEILQKILSVESENMEQAYYSSKEIQIFMMFFLNNIEQFEKLTKAAMNVRFLGEDLNTANKLYDPEDPLLQDLFLHEPRFPNTPFDSPSMVGGLKKLGLHSSDNIHVPDLLETAQCITRNKVLDKTWTKKSNALLKVLEECQYLLEDLTLKEGLRDLMWITPADKLNGYPDILPRHGLTSLCRPSDVCSDSYIHIAGSVMPIISTTCKKLLNVFGWDRPPPMDIVFKQLDIVSQQYQTQYKPKLYESIRLIYEHLSSRMKEITEEHRTKLNQSNCVWTEGGFCQPNSVYIKQTCTDIDLKPYLFLLPPEWNNYSVFFRNLDCYDSQTTDALLTVQEAIRLKWESMAHAQTSSQTVFSLLGVMRKIRDIYNQGKSQSKEAVQRDLRIIIQILNNMKSSESEIDTGQLLFPTCLTDESKLVLKSAADCTYCDAGWLKDLLEDDDDLILVHPDVSNSTAKALGVKSLTQTLLSDTEGIQEWGQKEPLTKRLHHLLEGYSDGFSVPKEILQNADDAGATEVCLLYDERENKNVRSGLIDEGMAECQGPALWAYNDAEFTDADFENIVKLNGATKENDRTKIGKFGLGFSAVYNLTDVPSIVSNNTAVIFDPHMKYLGKAVKGREPGIKINLTSVKNKMMLKKMKNQFKPYKGVFGCDITSENHSSFCGTLFRFPLRTKDQAIASDISKIAYDKHEIQNLFKIFTKSAGNLLLFSQHVHNMKLFHLPAGENDPSQAELLMEVKKEDLETIPRNLPVLHNCSDKKTMMQLAADVMEQVANNQEQPVSMPTKWCGRLRIGIQYPSEKSDLIDASLTDSESQWIIAWATGTNLSLKLSLEQTRPGSLPFGSVAMLVKEEGGLIIPCDVREAADGFYKQGHIFCFLPLPIKTSLPVHINGCFAVASDRRSLSHPSEDEKVGKYSNDWNEAIMTDTVCNAYVLLLEKIHEFCVSPDYQYHQFWPTDISSKDCSALCKQLYRSIAHESPRVFYGSNKWQALDNCVFLDPDFRSNALVGDIAYNTLVHFKSSADVNVVDFPRVILTAFEKQGCQQAVQKHILSMECFFKEVFFPNIHSQYWTVNERDALTLFALDSADIRELLKQHRCVPCKPDGELRYPSDVVNPMSFVACMFGESDGRFPLDSIKQTFCTENRLLILRSLGMMEATVPVNLLVDRAQSVVVLNQTDGVGALERCKSVFKYLAQINIFEQQLLSEISTKLHDIPFLPVLKKPEFWPIHWHANIVLQHKDVKTETMQLFASGSELFDKSAMYCVGALRLVLDKQCFAAGSYRVARLLGVAMKEDLPLDIVAQQLLLISNTDCDQLHDEQISQLEITCSEIYVFLNKKCSDNKENNLEILQNKSILFLNQHFVQSCKTAYQKLQCDCTPELFSLYEREPLRRLRNFLTAVGVKEHFDPDDINDVIGLMKEKYGSEPLPEIQLNLICNLVISLAKLVKEPGTKTSGTVFMPDKSGVLWNVNDLCRDDCEFALHMDRLHVVHSSISHNVAELLGVKTIRQQNLKHYSRGLPFGQSEKLTTRLKHLVDAYPWGIEIMKELLQNADDAGASKLHFIKDFRQHPCKTVFEDSWKPLQGPALCAYNDSSFTRADLEGIQRLGEGSKSMDPTKTGKYGVGFNAVYHLTDVPSFLTKGENVDGGETLCVLDPHCLYVPGATAESPGEQYVELGDLRTDFPDVFDCYPDKMFDSDSGTLFRFPLRDEEMAKESQIKNQPITDNDVNELIEIFKKEMMENLLFMKNVTSLAVYNMTADGLFEEEYVMNASMSEDCKNKRQEFFNYLKSVVQEIQNGTLNVCDIEKKQVTYKMTLHDNKGLSQTWCIVQQLGFLNGEKVPDELQTAVNSHDFGLLPHGGVAFLLPEVSDSRVKIKLKQFEKSEYDPPMWQTSGDKTPNRLYDFKGRGQRHGKTAALAGKAFCFLPLPEVTGLPVHVNGHFCLDYESRRHLWKDNPVNSQCYRTLWNRCINENVISDCYVSALHHLKMYLFQEHQPALKDGVREVRNRLSAYHELFPIHSNIVGEYWTQLTCALYRQIDSEGEQLFPVIHTAVQKQQQGEVGIVEWVGLKAVDGGKFQSFFSNIEDDITRAKNGKLSICKKDIQKIMKELGMKLIDCPMHLFDSIEKSGVSVKKLEPCHIRDFLKSFNEISLLDHCRLMVDVPLAGTVFQSTDLIHIVLEYCNLDDKLLEHLDGLPLLVTQDEVLRVFKTDKPVFSSMYCELISSATSLNKLFLHHSLVLWSQLLGHSCSVFKRFTMEAFADFLPDILDASMYKSENYIDWNPQASTIANKRWIEKVWLFFLDDMHKTFELLKRDVHEEVKIRMTEENLDFLEDWCLYPACNGSNTVLVPVCETKIVLNIYSFQGKLLEALRKLDLPRPNTEFPEEVRKQFLTMAACSKNAEFVLHCLYKQKEKLRPAQFSSSDAECVLQFFNDRLSELRQNISRDILVHRLRSLPFYETAAGQMTMLPQSCTTIVVPSEIPKQGLDEWAKQSNYKLLKKNHVLFRLHEHLHFCLKTSEELYYNHIILTFNNLPQHAWIHHIKFIKDELLRLRLGKYSDSQSKLIRCLTNLSFLQGNNEQLCKASDFFSPFDSVFKAMLEGEDFPPAPYCYEDWREFMEVIGMKKVVTTDMFVQFAKQVEQEGKQAITDTVKEKSNVLVKHLFARKKVWNDPVLQRISNIYFLAPYKADKQYTDICPQKECTRNFIAFSDSVPPSLVKLSWTTHNILLWKNDPGQLCFNMTSANKEKILVELGICFSPSVDNVILHIQNVCDSLKTLLDSPEKRKSLNTGVIDEVMKSFYQHLLPKLKDEGKDIIRKRLHITPILFLKEDNCLVPAQQAVQNLSKDQEIKPYLVKAPVHYGEFFPLFEHLGTEANPTANHFAKVLSALHEETDDEELDPNELKSMCMAVKSLFEKLHHGRKDENNELTVNKLYLPSKENKLVLSTELIFPDNAYYEERIGIQDQLVFFAGFTKLEMDIFDTLHEIQKIPEMHRPTMLTSIIREHLVCMSKDVFLSDKTKTLQDFLHTPEFFNAVVRLIQHKRQKQTDPDQEPEEEQEQIWNSLQQIKIAQVSYIKTELTVQNCCIPSSRQTVKCFCDLSQKDGKEHLLYITDCNISSVISELLKLLVQYVHKSLQRCKRHLTFIVLVYIQTPEEIKSYLDNENVRQCNVSLDNMESLFPPLGTIVPPKLHHLLYNSFCDFTNREYVALELFDKEIDSNSIDTEGLDAHFIYARVVRKIQTAAHSECMTQLLQKYDVNIGDKSIQVIALDIYKFHRKKKSKSKELVPVEIIPTPQSTLSLDQIKRKIKELLMESWSLSEDQRKKIIKRLILKWHPDKNHGNEELCTEVFQFILNILSRLENGENLDDDDVDGASRHPRNARSYYNFGGRMFRRGQSYASHRKGYYSHREDADYAFYGNYQQEPQPNPLESKRWMRQAKCDLEAAKITIAVANQFQCYNWVCYKCQQSAEKALIAAWYARDSRKVNHSHDLPTVASGLGEELEKWAKQLQDLIGDHRRMRYPETGRMLNIPSDIYTRNMAEQAWKIAHNIVNRVAESH